LHEHLSMNDFLWHNPSHVSDPEFGDVHFTHQFYGDTSVTSTGSLKLSRKFSVIFLGHDILEIAPTRCEPLTLVARLILLW